MRGREADVDRETKLCLMAALLVPTVIDEMRRNSDIGVATLDNAAREEAVRQARFLENEVIMQVQRQEILLKRKEVKP